MHEYTHYGYIGTVLKIDSRNCLQLERLKRHKLKKRNNVANI